MAKIIWGFVIVLAISLGLVIHTGCHPEVLPEEAVQLELERVEEIVEEDEKIKVLPEEIICPDREEKVDRLIQELGDEDRGVRRNAAEALGEIGDPRAVEPLIASLGDENRWVRWGAVRALGKTGDPRAVEPLIASLKDEDMHIQWAAVVVLERITGKAFGRDPVKWQEWWEENKEAFLKER